MLPPLSGKQHFLALDGLRGVAAVVVLVMHRGRWFYAPGGFLGHGYLAVDFFFLLSGFVIAFAYDDRIAAGMSPWRFMGLRLIRLYPLIFLGTLLGVIWPVVRMAFGEPGALGPLEIAYDLVRGLLLIPDNWAPSAGDSIFPLDGPTWSLFFELLANLGFALIGARLTWKPLIGIVGASALLMTYCAFHGGVDIGGRPAYLLGGFPRTALGFFGGVLLFRLLAASRRRGWAMPALPAPFVTTAIALVALLATPSHYPWNPYFDLVCLLVLFPILVTAAAAAAPAQGPAARFCRLAGDLSYPLYVLHYPLYVLIGGLLFQGAGIHLPAPLSGTFAGTIIIGAAWLALKVYDEPVRRRLILGFKARLAHADA